MTLDLVGLASRMDELVNALEIGVRQREQRLGHAASLLGKVDATKLADALDHAEHANWLMALPVEPPATRRPAPSLIDAYAVLATDGSSIDVDRHSPATCYLINIGHAWLHYGESTADLGTDAELAFTDERLSLGDNVNASKESVMTGNLLDAYRTAREMLTLADLAATRSLSRPLVCLLDGQLVLWGLKESELSSSAQEQIFDQGVLKALDSLYGLARDGRLAIGSYISLPGGREVTNSLRIAACPREPYANCRDCPRQPGGPRPCDDVAGGADRHLFARLLAEGERSAVFRRYSTSTDFVHADKVYADRGHELRFFYLKVSGGEIGRVEVPEWVAADPAALDLVHAVVLDQCARGNGYPLVLQEAHEQAVIDGADRRSFTALVDREMEQRGIWSPSSGKAMSKRRRMI